MNTQTPIGPVRLWNRNFWLMSFASLLLSMSVTMLIPTMPSWLLLHEGLTTEETGVVMGIFGVGLFLPGAFCSYLVQRYRRNLVCVWAVLLLALTMLLPLFVNFKGQWLLAAVVRLAQGACYGLSQMILASTLIIDTCQSAHRTEANHSTAWFSRFGLCVGPLVALLLVKMMGYFAVPVGSAVCCIVTAFLILSVHFPFRVPYESPHLFSLDRFILTSGWPLLLFLFVFTVAVGLVLALPLNEHFYGLLMVGFLLSLLAQRIVFSNADLKSEVVSGLLFAGAALLLLITNPQSVLVSPLLGFGMGMVGARFLLFFVKLSHHCQRGTALSTFMLGWESGLAVGIGMGYLFFADSRSSLLFVSLALIIIIIGAYVGGLHKWFLANKIR